MKKSNRYLIHIICTLCLTTTYAQQPNIDSLFSGISMEPGVAVAVYKDGSYVYKETFGLSNLDYDTKITEETIFDVGGLSMHFTASSILLLEDEGKLKLTDKVSKYLLDFPDYAEGGVTIDHLLHHTSGVMDYLVALSMSGHKWDTPFNSDDAYNFIIKNPKLGFTPGNEYEYSNSNYLLLSKLVQKLSGKSLNEYASENIFKPLGMNQTFYYEDAKAVIKNRATAYSKVDEEYKINHHHNFTSVGEGRLCTSLNDLMLWANALQQNKLAINDLESRLTARGVLNNKTEISYALGLQHGIEKGYPFYAHSGYWTGFSAMFLKVPGANFWTIILSNNESISAPSKAYDILDRLIKDRPQNEISTKAYKVSQKELRKYEGNYFTYKNGYKRQVLVKNDTLFYNDFSGTMYSLEPISKGLFKVRGTITDYSIQFRIPKNGAKELDFLSNGIVDYKYEQYDPIFDKEINIDQYLGTFINEDLGIKYALTKSDKNAITIHVNGEELMSYIPEMPNIFCSESTHHGYLKFNNELDAFTLSDYSFKPIKFEKIRD